jgi:CRP/FNR family cyclic AMP-dependent transcriptional regulator
MSVEQMGEAVYVILNGAVKIHVEQEDGTDVIISVLGPGDIVGEMSLLDNAGRCANVATIAESTLLWMDRSAFHECLRAIPGLTYNLACILTNRLRLANEQIQALATLEVECRVARQLLIFAGQFGQTAPNGDIFISIRLTQSDIAGLVGASRERINKIIVSYKERNYVSVDQDHHLTIHNQKALAARCRLARAICQGEPLASEC